MIPGFPEITNLSPAEKLQLVEDLWDEIAANPSEIPVLNWQKEELARRKSEYLQNTAIDDSWEEVKKELEGNMTRILTILPSAFSKP